MNFFGQIAASLPEYRRLVNAVKDENLLPVLVTGLSHIHKAHFLAGLAGDLDFENPVGNPAVNSEQAKKHNPNVLPILVLCETESEGAKLSSDINTIAGVGGSDDVAILYPARDLSLGSAEVVSREYEHVRLEALCGIMSGKIKIILATPEAASQLTLPPEILTRHMIGIDSGSEISISELAEKLVKSGFTRCDMIEGVSQFSVRGSIIDIFPVNAELPVRIELWGDNVDSISVFDLETQRRIDTVKKISIAPAMELLFPSFEDLAVKLESLLKKNANSKTGAADKINATLASDIERLRSGISPKNPDKYFSLAYERETSLFDYINTIIISENVNCQESFRAVLAQHEEDLTLLFESGELCRGLEKYILTRSEFRAGIADKTRAYFDTFMRGGDLKLSEILNVRATQLSSWSGAYKLLIEELGNYFRLGYACVVFAGTEKAARTLAQDLKDDNIPVDFSENPKKIYARRAYILAGTINGGYDYPDAKCALISLTPRAETSNTANSRTARTEQSKTGLTVSRKKKKKGEEIRSITDISIGDYIVHSSYGIGIFEGVTKLTTDNVSKDYIKIKYAGTDILYVPVTQLDLISRYIGNTDSSSLKLNKLNTDHWKKSKTKAKAAATELATELIELYSKRMKSTGYAFPPDSQEQVEFENHFNYIETSDQLRCIEEIKADMEVIRPMDRLLCGDVGFGKTEVALRGAFKCVMDGKQCALLCPTTVLAWQHFQTVQKRMDGFPVNIELLSRFRSAKEVKAVLEKLKKGIVDMVIGTHRLIQEDVKFKNLGLVIIDEEQRFGVKHKDRLKETFTGVDILTLSATPIPRTLNMAMSGIRDMSCIETPPQDRLPVTTYVMEHDWGVIAQAINKELRRNGQVYYIHNRIESIYNCAAKIHEICPDAKIGIAHGRLDEDGLLEVWRKLLDQEINILVCTTLIETGIDVPNCNTLIIENADYMGLAQLHQLRGRVGRTNRRAYAYFTFKRGKVLTEIASKRLNAIREFTQFGSGFRIAMKDLEIRGAGSVLGSKQSGHLSAVGYDMYLKLLSEAVEEQNEKSGIDSGLNPKSVNAKKFKAEAECLVDIKIDAFIPESYIGNQAQRISCYKRIAEIRNEDDAYDVTDELIDRYGELPKSVLGLIEVAQLRNLAQEHGISEINQNGKTLMFYADKPDMKGVSEAVAKYGKRVSLNLTGRTGISFKLEKGDMPLGAVREFLECYRVE